jgi:hypothetical protein
MNNISMNRRHVKQILAHILLAHGTVIWAINSHGQLML